MKDSVPRLGPFYFWGRGPPSWPEPDRPIHFQFDYSVVPMRPTDAPRKISSRQAKHTQRRISSSLFTDLTVREDTLDELFIMLQSTE